MSPAPKISCLILACNEAARIKTALGHALAWADEVVVVDKGSTDGTRELARSAGARVASIPFSRQGHENLADLAAAAANDWVWCFTPGEVPTRRLIEAGRALVGDDVDLILVPMHYYSFGVHAGPTASPWSGGWQPRLYHRHRVTFTGNAHDPLRAARVARLDGVPGVLHQTHATADSFLRSHADYAVNEAAQGTPPEVIGRASRALNQWARPLAADPALIGQALGWQIYWLSVMLHAWEREHPGTPSAYAARAAALLEAEWSAEP